MLASWAEQCTVPRRQQHELLVDLQRPAQEVNRLLPCALEATVLRASDLQTTSWELLLPEEAKRLPAELQAVDLYLDDERFVAPWRRLPADPVMGGWW